MTEIFIPASPPPGVRPATNEYGEPWAPPEPPKPTVWATPPPADIALTPAEQAVRDELEERRRAGSEHTADRIEALRTAQRALDARLAAAFALPSYELTELLEQHAERLAPLRERLSTSRAQLERATAAQQAARRIADQKAAALVRFEDAERDDAERYSRAVESSIETGEPAIPVLSVDPAAKWRAEVEARGATAALGRLNEAVNAAAASLSGIAQELERTVDELIYREITAGRFKRLDALIAEAKQVWTELEGYRFSTPQAALHTLDAPTLGHIGTHLRAIHTERAPSLTVEGAAAQWRERRRVLIAGELEQAAPQEAAAA